MKPRDQEPTTIPGGEGCPDPSRTDRRSFLVAGARTALGLALGGLAVGLVGRTKTGGEVWQIDPNKCTQCGRCETACVRTPSAVKCIHKYDQCGYCVLCAGYHDTGVKDADSAAENQLCPVGAIQRRFIEAPFYEYVIDEAKCIGCGKCVKGCAAFGNGSLYLQIRHDRCQRCNECAIMTVCPSKAISRVSTREPYFRRGEKRST